MIKNVVGYTCRMEDCDVTVEQQKETIEEYAKENDLNLVGYFEDDFCTSPLMLRKGINELICHYEDFEAIVVERAWVLSRNWTIIQKFLGDLENRNIKLVSTSTLWDCVSQRTRHYKKGKIEQGKDGVVRFEKKKIGKLSNKRKKIKKPEKLNFVGMVGKVGKMN